MKSICCGVVASFGAVLVAASPVVAQTFTSGDLLGSSFGSIVPTGTSNDLPYTADPDDQQITTNASSSSGQTGGGVLDGANRVASTRAGFSGGTIPIRGGGFPGIFVDISGLATISPGYSGNISSFAAITLDFTLPLTTPFSEFRAGDATTASFVLRDAGTDAPVVGGTLQGGVTYRLTFNLSVQTSGAGSSDTLNGRYELYLPTPGSMSLFGLGAAFVARRGRRA